MGRSTIFWHAIARDVREERYAAIISTPIEALDAVAARINEAAVEIIVRPQRRRARRGARHGRWLAANAMQGERHRRRQ